MPLDQPLLVIIIFEFLEGLLHLFDGPEGSDPEQIFLQGTDEPLGTAVPFGSADKGR